MATKAIYSLESEQEDIPIAQVGGKARSLMQLCSQGSNKEQFAAVVPHGIVLSVSFFEPWMTEIQTTDEWKSFLKAVMEVSEEKGSTVKEHCDALKERCAKLSLTSNQKADLDASISAVFSRSSGETLLVAVRSSSPEEDLAKMSFAGGYETTLGVRLDDDDELLRAILHSFASVFDYRVVQYKLQNNIHVSDPPPRIAVILQRQIDAAVSGVAFSLNPLNNCYDQAVITSNFGLGESVVSGVVTPDKFVVDKIKRVIQSRKISPTKTSCVHVLDSSNNGGVVVREEKKDDGSSSSFLEQLSSLTDEQIRLVTDMLLLVEETMGVPIDIEWAIEREEGGGKLYLLQARPITAYFPLFPELRTAPGDQERKKLYIDLIGLSQGFSDPLSTLGLDFWKGMLKVAKPHLTHGEDGLVQEIHGREYINISNLLACTAGDTLVKNLFLVQGGNMVRIWESINMDEYRPEAVTPKNKPVVWMLFKEFLAMIPSLFWGLWDPSKSMKAYLDECEKVFERFGVGGPEEASQEEDTRCTYTEEVEKCLDCCRAMFPAIAGFIASFYSKWRLHRMFSGNSEAQDLLVTLNMDMEGNPTSEMGHEMLRLASFPEIQQTDSADEFLTQIQDNKSSYSDEFRSAYDGFIRRFGCRGMKEIDVATPRTRECQGDLFLRIKMIDIRQNQILTVKKRKEEALQKLLAFAAHAGKESTFKYHAGVVQHVGGYREHPKYMYVFLVDYLRRRALKQGTEWVEEGRLDKADDIFFLNAEQVTSCQLDAQIDLKQLVAENRAPYDAYAHVKSWPVVIDSRGKIFRGTPVPVEGGLSGDPISHGVVRGKAKVLHTPYEKRVDPGEILVARATEPSWTPIFINAAGVVLEVGGPLQHGAIIAREYGIPCVSGVEEATTKIRDGDMLEVDGTNGIVKILADGELEKESS